MKVGFEREVDWVGLMDEKALRINEWLHELAQNPQGILEQGALVFDIDGTLLHADRSLNDDDEIREILQTLLKMRIEICLISGGSAKLAKERIFLPLKRGEILEPKDLQHFTLYADGGSSKLWVDEQGNLVEDTLYIQKNRLPVEHVQKVRDLLQTYLESGLELTEDQFQHVREAWIRKRDKQWADRAVTFRDVWDSENAFQLEYWLDHDMASVKVGDKEGAITFPFINVRGAALKEDGGINDVAAFSPSGFYDLCENEGDPLTFNVRAWLIEHLRQDLSGLDPAIVIRKAGRSTLDITKRGTDKAAAMKHFIQTHDRDAQNVFFLGDEFYAGGNDVPIALDQELKVQGVKIVAFCEKKISEGCGHVVKGGETMKDVRGFLQNILRLVFHQKV